MLSRATHSTRVATHTYVHTYMVGWLVGCWPAGSPVVNFQWRGSNNTGELCNTRYGTAREKGSVGEKRVATIVRKRVEPHSFVSLSVGAETPPVSLVNCLSISSREFRRFRALLFNIHNSGTDGERVKSCLRARRWKINRRLRVK